MDEDIVFLADISSGLIIPLNLIYSLPSFKTKFFLSFYFQISIGDILLITVTVIPPVKVLV